MQIRIEEKYLYVYEGEKQIQYFEHCEARKEKNNVVEIYIEDLKGKKFLNKNNGKIILSKVYWFGRKIKKLPVFFKEKYDNKSYLVLINE